MQRYLATSTRQEWTPEHWRTYERERKRRYRARQAQLERAMRTPTGALRLLEAMVEETTAWRARR